MQPKYTTPDFVAVPDHRSTTAPATSLSHHVRKIRVYRDDSIPAFGAWCAGSLKEGEPTLLLNVAACLIPCVLEDGTDVNHTVEEKKWLMISTLMHEFGHALQEFFDLEFTEEGIEKIADDYERHYLWNEKAQQPRERQ